MAKMTSEQIAAIREAALARIAAREAEQAAKQQQTPTPLPVTHATLAMIRDHMDASRADDSEADESKDDPVVPFDNGGMQNILNPFTLAKPMIASSPFKEMLASIPTKFNPAQQAAIELALQGKSFCLIGAAGTGKTTVTQTIIKLLQASENTRPIATDTKWLDQNTPGIVIVGFTNKAVNNIKKKLPPHLQKHCLTVHKLIEFQPFYYDVLDPENPGKTKKEMRFEPARNGGNPLPHISTIIHEESSMIGTDLFDQEMDALSIPARTQMVFLGDLNQLPPVFGPSILGFKLAELPTVELTHVYRQALMSPIISLATAIRTNNAPSQFTKPAKRWDDPSYNQAHLPWGLTEPVSIDRGEHGKLTIRPWKKRVHEENAVAMMKQFIPNMISTGAYNPAEDMILIPFNKAFGTIEVNKIIGEYLAKRDGLEVHEVVARYQKSYWAVGDRVMVDRQEAIIRKIEPTIGYFGKAPRRASKTMDRWGIDPNQPNEDGKLTADQIMNALDMLEVNDDKDDAKNLASHTITVWFPDSDIEQRLNTAGTINQMIFGWALTVHKSQGSEWERVFLFLHNTHAKGTLMSRELLYTAVTRAKHELYIICEGDIGAYTNSLARGAEKPVIPGTKLHEKIEFFRKKLNEQRNGSNSELMENA